MNFRPGGLSDSDSDDYDDFYNLSNQQQPVITPKYNSANNDFVDPSKAERGKSAYNFEYLRNIIENNGNIGELEQVFVTGTFDVNALEEGLGWSLLHYACKAGNPEAIKYLLAKGSDVNLVASGDCYVPLVALYTSHNKKNVEVMKTCLQILIDAGATLKFNTSRGMTALMFAALNNLPEVSEFLLDHGVDVNEADDDGQTALHHAVSMGYGRVARVLLQRGIEVMKLNDDGQSAYEIAATKYYVQLAEVLYKVATTKWTPGADPALLQEVADVPDSTYRALETERYIAPQKEQIEMTLERLGLTELVPVFQKHKINYLTFLRLTEEDLKNMGINEVGVRWKLIDNIRNLHNADWNKTSINSFYLQGLITCPEIVCMLSDMKNHLEFMTQSMNYLRIQLKAEPKALVFGSEVTQPSALSLCVEKAIQAGDEFRVQAGMLRNLFIEADGKSELKIGDLVRKPESKFHRHWLFFSVILLSGCMIFSKKFRLHKW